MQRSVHQIKILTSSSNRVQWVRNCAIALAVRKLISQRQPMSRQQITVSTCAPLAVHFIPHNCDPSSSVICNTFSRLTFRSFKRGGLSKWCTAIFIIFTWVYVKVILCWQQFCRKLATPEKFSTASAVHGLCIEASALLSSPVDTLFRE